MKLIDDLLNKITMYKLVFYFLAFLLIVAFIFGIFHILPYSPLSILLSVTIFLFVCIVTNEIFARVFKAPTNIESVYITALILSLIITPIDNINKLPLYVFASVISMASKYILSINKKHIFNPAAIAVTLTAIGFNGTASWWIGTKSMLPFVLLGILIIRKIRRFDLVYYFFFGSAVSILFFSITGHLSAFEIIKDSIFYSAIFFFAFIMLTEPLSTPTTKTLQSIYGFIIGVMFIPLFHVGSFFTTPETALVLGNVFSFIVSPKYKMILKLKQKIQTSINSFDFVFIPQKQFSFLPGQYMEWMLPHNADSRGPRRYFTIASSPTEKDVRIGVKFYNKSSTYKNALRNVDQNTNLIGSQLGGDFTLPKDKSKKLVFIAGGIGITPFRSMLKYLIDKNEKRSIILFYANKYADEIIYKDVLDEATRKLNIKVIYTLTDKKKIPNDWKQYRGRINDEMILREVKDYKDRLFYISGPNEMVESFYKVLRRIGIPRSHIKKDYFAGL